MANLLMEGFHFVKGLDPVADAFAGATVNADVVSMRGHERVVFVIYVGVGATGSSTITVESCDDVTPTTATAIPFWYREITTGDTEGAITRATATGFVNTAGSSRIVAVEAETKDMVAGDGFIRLDMAESVDSPVLGCILTIQAGEARYISGGAKATTIV